MKMSDVISTMIWLAVEGTVFGVLYIQACLVFTFVVTIVQWVDDKAEEYTKM